MLRVNASGDLLQRLFSTFANGVPGFGLMLQRFVIATVLIYGAMTSPHQTTQAGTFSLQIVDGCAGLCLLLGLWTPLVGTLIAGRELWGMFSGSSDPRVALILATLGATLAMIGPGAWSIDARRFGRRQIRNPR
ncbi:MAG: hypothetical protein WBY53_12820 [Acidobacteriaceae bacterium]